MNSFEKYYCIFAIAFAFALITSLILNPELRYIGNLLLVSSLGFVVNIGLMFIVLRDILKRNFDHASQRYFWIAMILLIWPSVIYYLPKFGFKPR